MFGVVEVDDIDCYSKSFFVEDKSCQIANIFVQLMA